MSIKFDGLPNILQLSKSDYILVQTSNGLKTLSAEVLGEVFSNTSLFDNYSLVESNEINVQNISTNNKVRKYFDSDTSIELYIEYKNGKIDFIKDTVVFDINTKLPVVVQATDLRGNRLYWNLNPDEAEFSNGLPWKNKDDKKVFMTTEETEYPVKIYQYTTSYVKRSEITLDQYGEPTIIDTFISSGQTSKGIIQKKAKSFIFRLDESGKNSCGLEVSVNKDGSITGKLIGTWEGLNDWNIEDVLLKTGFKNWFYMNQDYNLYSRTLSVVTADRIGWYLNKDTSNHVYTEINESKIKVMLAQNRISGNGTYIQEQAKNIMGQPLYWEVDMSYQAGVSSNHIPVHNGEYTFMTTQKTDWPVYVYQYTTTELFVIDVDTLSDGSKGVILNFIGSNGKIGEIYKTLTSFVMRYLDSTGKELSKITLGDTESELTGKWKSGDKILSEFELPNKEKFDSDKLLLLKDGEVTWTDREIPSYNGETNKILQVVDGKLIWVDKEIPECDESEEDKLLVCSGGQLVWKTLKELGITSNTEEPEPIHEETE